MAWESRVRASSQAPLHCEKKMKKKGKKERKKERKKGGGFRKGKGMGWRQIQEKKKGRAT